LSRIDDHDESKRLLRDDASSQRVYVTDGIDKKGVNKTILYGTKIISQFMENFKSFQLVLEKKIESQRKQC